MISSLGPDDTARVLAAGYLFDGPLSRMPPSAFSLNWVTTC